MVVNTVKQLVTRLSEVEKLIANSVKKLQELQEKHYDFWRQKQQKCAETLHDLTAEDIQRYNQEKSAHENWHQNRRRRKYETLQEKWKAMPRTSELYYKISYGYYCPYCEARVGCSEPTFGGESWRGYSKSFFEEWLKKDISNWPQEKKALFEEAKKELEDYFKEAEPIEQTLKNLRNEKKEIYRQLETIWDLCDKALGKDIQRSQEEWETEKYINNLLGIPSRDDIYYPD